MASMRGAGLGVVPGREPGCDPARSRRMNALAKLRWGTDHGEHVLWTSLGRPGPRLGPLPRDGDPGRRPGRGH